MAKERIPPVHPATLVETVEMEGPGGRVVVAKSDQKRYEGSGHKVVTPVEEKPVEKMSKDELAAKAAELGIEFDGKPTKDELIKAITDHGV